MKGNVTIDKVKSYGFKICGTEVNETNYDNIDGYRFYGAGFLKVGSVTYNPQNNQLSLLDNCFIVNKTADRAGITRSPTIENVSNKGLTIAVNNSVQLTSLDDEPYIHSEAAISISADTEIRGFGESPRLNTISTAAPKAGYISINKGATLKVSNEMTTGNGLNIETNNIWGASGNYVGKLQLANNVTIKAVGRAGSTTVKGVEISAPNLYGTPVVSTESAPAIYLSSGSDGPGVYGKRLSAINDEVRLTTKNVKGYNLTVGGEKVNSNNCECILTPTLKSGRVYYRDDTKWLVLDNVVANMSNSETKFIESSVEGLEVRITGGNEISNLKSYGMEFDANATLKGLGNGGSLTLRGSDGGIKAWRDLTIETNSVSYLMPYLRCDGNLVLETPITLSGSNAGTLRYIKNLTLKNGLTPYANNEALEVKNIANEGYAAVGSDGKPFTRGIIFRKSTFDDPHITVGDVDVTEANMNDVLRDGGSVKYSTEGKLTLTNATINGTDYALRTRTGMPLEIEVIGNCKLNSTTTGSFGGPNTMSLATNTTFTGTGTLIANKGINVMGSYFCVDGPYVRCNGGDLQGCQGGESMTVKSGKLYARIIQGFKEFTLGEGIAITVPEGAYYDIGTQRTLKADGTVASGVMIAKGVPYVPVTGVSLNKAWLMLTTIGETTMLYATVSPSDATNQKVTWSSDDESVATVTNGRVKAVGDGTAIISAKVAGDCPDATCVVTVNTAVDAKDLSLNKQELVLRIFDDGAFCESEKLVPIFDPEDATDKSVEWSVDDKSVVSVVNGRVQAVGEGETTVTCSATGHPGLTATCTVSVVPGYTSAYGTFTVNISEIEDENIQMRCHITDPTNNYCEVVTGEYSTEEGEANVFDPAIDIGTEGDITIPAEAVYVNYDTNTNVTYQVTRINNYAFKGCQFLTSITLPEGLQTIGFEAFSSCSHVKTLYLPSTLVSIDDNAFNGCASLESVFMMATTPPEVGVNGFAGGWWDPSLNPTRTLYVPAASLKLYKQQAWTKWFDKILPIGRVAGDTDGDGEVTSTDAEAITDYLLGKGNIDTEAADIDGDGEVTITDITAIIQRIIGN